MNSSNSDTGRVAIGPACDLGVRSEDVAAFYRDEWARRIVLSDATFYRWQFVDAPANAGRDMNCVAVDGEGRLLGVMGLNERPFMLNGLARHGAELTTWVISPNARGRGVGVGIMQYLQQRYEVLLGMGITPDALPIYMRGGFQYLRAIPRFVRIFNVEAIGAHLRIDKLGRQLVEAYRGQPASHYSVETATGSAVEAVAERFFKDFNGFVRDWPHVQWRLTEHPVFRYTTEVVDHPDGRCVLSYRIDNVEGMRVMHVVDCFGDREAFPAVCSYVDDIAIRDGVHVADWYLTSARLSSMLRPRGWFSTLDDDCVQFTHLFYPPELRIPPTTSLVYFARGAMPAIGDLSRLYVAKADLDLDRPTMAYLESRDPTNAL